MYYICESEDQLRVLENYGRFGGYMEVISTNSYYHPKLSQVVAVYLRPNTDKGGFIIPISHEDGINVPIERVLTILKAYKTLHVLDKKRILYYFALSNLIDLSLIYSMTYNSKLEVSSNIRSIEALNRRFTGLSYLNRAIPLTKLFERSETIYEQISKYLDLEHPSGFSFYNDKATSVFYLIESEGIEIYIDRLLSVYNVKNIDYNVCDSILYTYYNLYNITSRPTNSFNGINYVAIPKDEEHRSVFRTNKSSFVEIDYDGYHLRLLADQVGYEIEEKSAHNYLAKIYFNKEDITKEEYEESKKITFHALYGKVPEEYNNIELFVLIQEYINNKWEEYKTNGYISDPISGKRFTNDIPNMNPAKLISYLIQSLETSRNITILYKVLKYLKKYKTKVVLYTYDSILFDYDNVDGKDMLIGLRDIIEENGKYPVKVKVGKTMVL